VEEEAIERWLISNWEKRRRNEIRYKEQLREMREVIERCKKQLIDEPEAIERDGRSK
jgi:hypothetical protein